MRLSIAILLASLFLCAGTGLSDPGKGKGHAKGHHHHHAQDEEKKGRSNSRGNAYARGREKHSQAVAAISAIISTETGVSSANYAAYAGSLADTLGQFSDSDLREVLGEHFTTLP